MHGKHGHGWLATVNMFMFMLRWVWLGLVAYYVVACGGERILVADVMSSTPNRYRPGKRTHRLTISVQYETEYGTIFLRSIRKPNERGYQVGNLLNHEKGQVPAFSHFINSPHTYITDPYDLVCLPLSSRFIYLLT